MVYVKAVSPSYSKISLASLLEPVLRQVTLPELPNQSYSEYSKLDMRRPRSVHVNRTNHARIAAIPCLTAVNPYIASSLDAVAKRSTSPVYMPKEGSGSFCKVTGISGFAFQGTNAHLLLSRHAS